MKNNNKLPDNLAGADWLQTAEVLTLKKLFNGQLRFVGGCVRNALLGLPISDFDLATTLTPDAVLDVLASASIKAIPTGIDHGTITAVINGVSFEITTLRKDIDCDGRHSTVEFSTSWEEDSARRDFTINALYCDFEGAVFDYHDGLSDLKERKIVFIGDAKQRCKEDYLRVLRFFRFNAHYGTMPFDGKGMEACALSVDQLQFLSVERVWHELLKLLSARNPVPAINAMNTSGVSQSLFERELIVDNVESIVTLEREYRVSVNPILRLAGLLFEYNDYTQLMGQWPKKFKMSRKQSSELVNILGVCGMFGSLDQLQMRHFVAEDMGPKIMVSGLILRHAAWHSTNHLMKSESDEELIIEHCIEECRQYIRFAKKWQPKKFPINGNDIKNQTKIRGKDLGDVLHAVKTWWFSHDREPERDDVMRYVTYILRQSR